MSMDSPTSSSSSSSDSRAKPAVEVLLRCSFALGFFFISILSLSYAFGFFVLLFATFSIPPPISAPSQCKIVSSSVDLRSSRICELGLLNYKAKLVFYPSERRKFRCRYDYYWASIFKVNESYDCWYTSGRSKVEIFQDSFFGCQAKDPPFSEMMKRYSILFTKMLQSWISDQIKSKHVRWDLVLGGIGGFLIGIISLMLFTLCSRLLYSFPRSAAAMIVSLFHRVIFSRMFLFVAYFSIVGWFAIQYCKILGFAKLFADY